MGYKVLGYVIWHGLTWYVRRHAREARRGVAISGVVGLVLAGLVGAFVRQRASQRS